MSPFYKKILKLHTFLIKLHQLIPSAKKKYNQQKKKRKKKPEKKPNKLNKILFKILNTKIANLTRGINIRGKKTQFAILTLLSFFGYMFTT